VKVGAPTCPFCGGAVPTSVPARTFAIAVGKPLTRAALLFAGAAAVAAVPATACDSSTSPTTPERDADADDGATGGDDGGDGIGDAVALYGAFVDGDVPKNDAGEDDAGDDDSGAGLPDGAGAPLYGAMALPDSGK